MQRIVAGTLLLVVSACGGGEGTGPAPAVPVVRSVVVTPPTASVRIGDTQSLNATVDVTNGGSIAVTWTSESPAVATVNAQGFVTGVAVGTAVIRATSVADTKVSATATITVAAVRSVVLSPNIASIVSGEQRTLTADVQLEAGASRAVTWRSSATAVATVTQAGVVTGVAVGSTTITAVAVADTNVRGTATITVQPSIRSVAVTPATASLFINGTQALSAAVVADGALAQSVTWRTSSATVATVNASGVVTAVGLGQASITALSTVDTTKRASATITVAPRPFTLDIVQSNVGINPGLTTQLTVSIGADPGVNTGVTWSSSTPAVATVSATGLVTGVAAGSTLITAVAQFDATKRDTVTVTVVPRLVTSWTASRLGGPLYEDILALSAFSATSAFVVNVFGDIYRWDGLAWTLSTRGSTLGTQFIGMHGTSASNLIAVGTNGVIARYNGTAWTPMTSGTTRVLTGVFVESATSAFAVGTNGTVLRLTGTAWAPITSGSTVQLNAVWAGAGQAFFAGSDGELLRYDGTTVSRQTSGTTEDLYTVGGIDASNVVAAGSAGTVLRYNGTAWTLVNSNGITGSQYSIVRGAQNRLYLAGDNGLVSLDGTTLATVSTPYAPRMFALAVDANGVLWTGGQRGFVQRGLTSGNSTTFETLNLVPDLLDVWSTASNSAWAVGEFGYIYRWNGTTWTRQSSPTTATLTSIWAPSATDAFAGGENGVMLRWNGTTWTSMTLPTVNSVLSVWGSSSANVYATTTGGEVLRYNGTAWSQVASSSNALWAVFGASPSEVYASGEGGTILRFNGTTWAPLTSPAAGTLTGVWMSGSDNVVAVGADAASAAGTAFRYNGTAWAPLQVNSNRVLTSVWGPSVADLYATGDAGTLLRFDGSSWQAMTSGTTDLLWSVTGSPNGVGGAFAVGFNGTLVSGTGPGGMVAAVLSGPTRGSLDPSAAARTNRVRGGALPVGDARRLRKQARVQAALNAANTRR